MIFLHGFIEKWIIVSLLILLFFIELWNKSNSNFILETDFDDDGDDCDDDGDDDGDDF